MTIDCSSKFFSHFCIPVGINPNGMVYKLKEASFSGSYGLPLIVDIWRKKETPVMEITISNCTTTLEIYNIKPERNKKSEGKIELSNDKNNEYDICQAACKLLQIYAANQIKATGMDCDKYVMLLENGLITDKTIAEEINSFLQRLSVI